MADVVTSQTLLDSTKLLVLMFTNASDGTGESAVLKADVSTFTGMSATSRVSVRRIWYSTQGMAVKLFWDATTDVLMWNLPQDITDSLDFTEMGGLQNNAGAGITGDIMLSTIGHAAGDSYTIILEMVKNP